MVGCATKASGAAPDRSHRWLPDQRERPLGVTIASRHGLESHLIFQAENACPHACGLAHEQCVSGNPEELSMASRIAALSAATLIPFTLALTPLAVQAEEPSRQMFENGIVRVDR